MQRTCDNLDFLLIGKTGSGVSASANTVLGGAKFKSERSLTSITDRCQEYSAVVSNRRVTVIDSPNLFNSNDIDLSVELKRGLRMCSSGIHAILLVLRLHTFTEQDAKLLSLYKQMFGENALKHTIVVFTHGDELKNKSFDQLIRENTELCKLGEEVGGRFHLLNNRDSDNRDQVTKLLMKIERMKSENENRCYTLQMFTTAQLLNVFLKPHHLYEISFSFLVSGLGWVIMRSGGSWSFMSFLHCCVWVFSALVGHASGLIWAKIWKNQCREFGKCTKRHLRNIKLLAVTCGCAAGGISVCLVGPVGLSTALLRGTQGGLMAYATLMNHYWCL